ncbi:IclR family transcriptional regulator [Aeromicrobium sp. A1-2]|uniref:IclR family transcriptional regulator n=1 Tax=Aeromicrobium sp. A1-2 TaxID=2107713 RepID=UPI0020B1092F|nr:IclR family transcriptional regulator [Aeromicrobium sp. A1-2]
MTTADRPHVVSRAAALLRAVGALGVDGGTTTELAGLVCLARPTVHRLLTSLAEEGLLDRDRRSGRWLVGPELYLLGVSASGRYDITSKARDIVRHLAAETGESAFLSARRGDETVCLLREDGSFPLRSHVLYEGVRFPLGVASAGLAILAHLPVAELDAYLHRMDLSGLWGEDHGEVLLRERVAETRVAGFATNPGLVVEGSWGMAAAVFDADGSPSWALSLTGVETRFRPDRRPVLGSALLTQAHELSRRLT